MSLPRFFDRVADAALPALGNVQRAALGRYLGTVAVTLKAEPAVADHPEQADGFLLAANLAARLYPRLALHGPSDLVERAEDLVLSINPGCDVVASCAASTVQLVWGASTSEGPGVGVSAVGWNVAVDDRQPDHLRPASPPAALAAVVVGSGPLLSTLFPSTPLFRSAHKTPS